MKIFQKRRKSAAVAAILIAALLSGCAGNAGNSGNTGNTGNTGSGGPSGTSGTSEAISTTSASVTTGNPPPATSGTGAKPSQPLGQRTLSELIDAIYSSASGVQFPTLMTHDVSLDAADADLFRYYYGIDQPDGTIAAAASEPMIGSIPYTLALLQVKEGADTAAIAAAIKSGVDPHKWICVWADVVETAHHGDVILLIMDKDADRAKAVLDAFDKVMGD